jgi:chromosome segregation ATPase
MKSKALSNTLTVMLMGALVFGAAIPGFAQSEDSDNIKPEMYREQERERKIFPVAPRMAVPADLREEFKEVREEVKEDRMEIKAIHMEAREDFLEKRAETKELLKEAEDKEERRGIIQTTREEVKADRAEVRELTKEKKEEIRASQRYMFMKRFFLAEAKLSKALEGIDSRIEKISADGMDMSKAVAYSDSAAEHLENFKNIADKMKALLDESVETEEEKSELKENLRELMEEGKAELKSAHEDLREAVAAIKAVITENEENEA